MRGARRPDRVSALRAYQSDGASDGLSKGSGYSIFSDLIAGMLAYGGIGWLIGHFAHISLLFPIGMLVGLAISVAVITVKFTTLL
jgi:F0F1-type ATP synthase assembly protein I